MPVEQLDHVESLLRRDPGRRGLAGYRSQRGYLAAGHYQQAVADLAQTATHVAIVTGFCIPVEHGWTAETDGPPGALFLARALLELGVRVRLLSDEYGRPLLEAGADNWRLPRSIIETIPFESPEPDDSIRWQNGITPRTDAWVRRFLASDFGRKLSHLVAIERCGPSHTVFSWAAQQRSADAVVESLFDLVPIESYNLCHNMRGEPIEGHTAKAHRLFEIVEEEGLPVRTIGVADGGNEIGVGAICFEDVLAALGQPERAKIICRIETNQVLLAGVSNWGGYALALGVCHARNQLAAARAWRADDLGRLMEVLVRDAAAVDGVSRRREASVDGIPLADYLAYFNELRQAFGLDGKS
ncbi:MAG: glutamate cyclase domain-containing protein [Pirellulales bacterium]